MVVLAGRRQTLLDSLAAELAGRQPVLPVRADVREPDEVEALFTATVERFGRIDVLFNNAGIGSPGVPIEELPVQAWLDVIATNLTGTFLCTRQAVGVMKRQTPRGGRIINNGSISAHVPRPNSAPYSASKHGITGLTRSTSLDGRIFEIACSQIDIGNATSDMTASMSSGMPQADGSMKSEPTFDVRRVAETVRYLAALPLDVSVPFLTITATGMPYIGRG